MYKDGLGFPCEAKKTKQMSIQNFVKDGNRFVQMSTPDYQYPTIDDGQYVGIIGNGGLMLCRLPEETAKERAEYYGLQTRDQMVAVDSDLMKEQHPSMPISNKRQSRVTFGGRASD